jgi:hypothetical protein
LRFFYPSFCCATYRASGAEDGDHIVVSMNIPTYNPTLNNEFSKVIVELKKNRSVVIIDN